MKHQHQRSQADAAIPVQSDVASPDIPTSAPSRIPSDHQFLLKKAKPQLDALKLQVKAEDAAREKPLSRKILTSRVRGEVERDEQQRRAAEREALGLKPVVWASLSKKEQQLERKVRKQIVDEQQEAFLAQVTARVEEIMAQQNAAEALRRQEIESRHAAIMEEVRRTSQDDLRELARQREVENQELSLQRTAKKETVAVQVQDKPVVPLVRKKKVRVAAPAKEKPVRALARVQSEAAFLAEKAAPLLAEAKANGIHLSKRTLYRDLRIQHCVELQKLQKQRDAHEGERKQAKLAAAANAPQQSDVVARAPKPRQAPALLPTDEEYLRGRAIALVEEAQERRERLDKPELISMLWDELETALEAKQRKPNKPADDAATSLEAGREPTRAQLKRRVAAAANEALPATEIKQRKAPAAIPTDDDYLRARATAIVAEAQKRDEYLSKSEVVRRLRVELKPELDALERRREQARQAEQAERDARANRPQTERRPRHSFYEAAAKDAAKNAAKVKKSDKRRERREARLLQEAAADKAAGRFQFETPQDCVTAARELMANKNTDTAVRLLAATAHKLAPQDPARFELARELGKGSGVARAVDVLSPMIGHEQHGEQAEAMLASMQLAQGNSRIAVELLERTDRASLKTLKAAAELSWAIRTSDDVACDKALAQLTEARFSNKGQALLVDLSAYPGIPQQVRLSAGTLKYANHLGEGLMRANRLHESVAIYDTLLTVKPKPNCSSERREVIQALKSSGKAYYEYGVANRKALGQVSLPDSPATAWNLQAQHEARTTRIGLAGTADKYLDRAFERLYHAFELNGTDVSLRNDLAKVIELTGNPHQFEQVNKRVHRRQKAIADMLDAPNSDAVISQLQSLSSGEELSKQETRLLRELHRNRQATLLADQQRQELIELMAQTREVSDKPAHMPSSLARQRRFHSAPRR